MKSEKWSMGRSKLIPRIPAAKGEEGGNSCKQHPSLDLDTICFHPACRQGHSQIICSYCGQESEQHRDHIEHQFPIYKTSPGFRLVSKYPAEGGDFTLPPNLEENKEVTEEIKALVQSQMQQVLSKSLQKMKCFGEFLNKNAIFSICNKIRHGSGEHQDCCLRMVNKLKDIEAEGEISQRFYEQAVYEEIQSAKEQTKQRAQYIKGEISKLFADINGEVKIEDAQRSIEELDTTKNEERTNTFASSFINELMNMSNLEKKQRRLRPLPNEESLPQVNQKRRLKRSQSVVISRRHQNKVPKGVDHLNANTIRIWNGNTKKYYEIFRYLSAQTTTIHLIIDHENFTSHTYINSILSKMSWLQGLHVHCKSKLCFSIPPHNQLQYFSFLPSYRFIRLVDMCYLFSSGQARPIIEEEAKSNIETFANDVRFKNMYIYKNRHINIPQFIEELHFFRSQNEAPWTLRRQLLMRLDFPINLLILSFQDIILSETASLKHLFQRCCKLHTLVFKNCEGSFNKIVKQLRYFKIFQLCHLQLSGGYEKKICLQPDNYKEIFHNRALETLILTNIEFLDERREIAKNSQVLSDIHKLKFLAHLNLYSSEPVYNDLLEYLHKESYQKMEMLNLGHTQITPKATKSLSKFRKLEGLCLDSTDFSDADMLQVTKEMWALRHLSIEKLPISAHFFTNMSFKGLRNVNIYGCENLHDYRWEKFSELECLRIKQGQISLDLFYYLRARAIAINIEKADQPQDQTRSLESSGNTNGSWTIEEECEQSSSESEPKYQEEKSKLSEQSLPQRKGSVRLEESNVTPCITRLRARQLENHGSAKKPASNPLSILLSSRVQSSREQSEHNTTGSASSLVEQDSD